MKGITKVIKSSGRPVKYPFLSSAAGSDMLLVLDTRKEAKKVRCAAHTLAFNHNWKFETKIRETDAGKFELTVKRIK